MGILNRIDSFDIEPNTAFWSFTPCGNFVHNFIDESKPLIRKSNGKHIINVKLPYRSMNHNFAPFTINALERPPIMSICGRHSPTKFSKPDGLGLYLIKSTNEVDWELVQKTPVIRPPHHPGFTTSLNWEQKSLIDGVCSCVKYMNGKYFLYMRANPSPQIRHIQVATSDDMINWSPFRLISFDNMPFSFTHDNYYFPAISEYDNKFLGILPYYRNDGSFASLRFVSSYDGYNFHVHHDFFKEKPNYLKRKFGWKSPKHPSVNSCIDYTTNTMTFGVQTNYANAKPQEPCTFDTYTLDLNKALGKQTAELHDPWNLWDEDFAKKYLANRELVISRIKKNLTRIESYEGKISKFLNEIKLNGKISNVFNESEFPLHLKIMLAEELLKVLSEMGNDLDESS